jgi:hypothetical protein
MMELNHGFSSKAATERREGRGARRSLSRAAAGGGGGGGGGALIRVYVT